MRVSILLYFLVCVHSLYAQQYFFSRYTPKNGLVNNRARTLFQDSKGRLYICTYGGLSVYDGARFINYTTEDGLVTSLVNEIVEMGDDSLWVIPNGKDLHCIVHGIFKNIQMADGFYPVINHIIHSSDGHYYALCDEGLYRLEQGPPGQSQHGPSSGQPSLPHWVRINLPDSTGTDVGRNIFNGVEWHRQLILISQPFSYVQSPLPSLIIYNLDTRQCLVPGNSLLYVFSALTPDGDLLLATDKGVRKVDSAALSHQTLLLRPPSPPYTAANDIPSGYLYFDRDSSLWMVPAHNVTRIDRDGSTQEFSEASGLPPGETTAVLQDRENNIWFASEQNGIVKLVSRQVRFYHQPASGFNVSDISSRISSDSVWFYDGADKRLLLKTGSTEKIFHGAGPLPDGGHIIVGSQPWLINGHDIYKLEWLPGQRFHASLIFHDSSAIIDGNGSFDPNGNIIIASTKLTCLVNGRVEQFPITHYIDQAFVDKYHHLWTATRGHELSVYNVNTSGHGPYLQLLKKFNKELPNFSPRSLTVDGQGRVWVGTRDHGLYCFTFHNLQMVSSRQITIAGGLSENFVNYLLCDDGNTIWACTPTGLNRIRLEEDHLTIENAIPGSDIYQHIEKILPSAGGIHWVLTRDGFMKIDPSGSQSSNYLPPLLFSKVLVGGSPIPDPTGSLVLPYDHNTLSFFIGTPTFSDEALTRYTWQLEGGRDPKWSTPSIQSSINFANLLPGRYTLRVRAQFLTGRYPGRTAAYAFIIRPPWWQTWWFRLALVLVLTAVIALAIRIYIRRRLEIQRIALEKKQAIEKERTRIATDMHDDLGAGLSRIKFLSETIGIKKQQQLPIEEEITSIREYSHEMIDKMGEIVWALNEKNDSLSDLLSYTRSYAVEYLLQAGISCSVRTPEHFPTLFVSGEFRRNVFLTIKETLHNIVKHAQASSVRMTMHTGRDLTIVIHDDGIGFDKGQVRPYSNGLGNMQRRIREIGGQLFIQPGGTSANGSGTSANGSSTSGNSSIPSGNAFTGEKGTAVKIVVPL